MSRFNIEVVKYGISLAIGATFVALSQPQVKTLFKLNKNKQKTIPSLDIEEEEIDEEC